MFNGMPLPTIDRQPALQAWASYVYWAKKACSPNLSESIALIHDARAIWYFQVFNCEAQIWEAANVKPFWGNL